MAIPPVVLFLFIIVYSYLLFYSVIFLPHLSIVWMTDMNPHLFLHLYVTGTIAGDEYLKLLQEPKQRVPC